jgi:hypothetical protein
MCPKKSRGKSVRPSSAVVYARKSVADAEGFVARQEMTLTRLRLACIDTASADGLLASMNVTLSELRRHLYALEEQSPSN